MTEIDGCDCQTSKMMDNAFHPFRFLASFAHWELRGCLRPPKTTGSPTERWRRSCWSDPGWRPWSSRITGAKRPPWVRHRPWKPMSVAEKSRKRAKIRFKVLSVGEKEESLSQTFKRRPPPHKTMYNIATTTKRWKEVQYSNWLRQNFSIKALQKEP